ncbi:MAG: hypothetical protein MZV65_13630 [Chromatiales bacterium]|nr:hypothetical protein [Chromatiales bacterium]
MDIAVDFDQIAAAGVAVKTVDVLGQHADFEVILQLGDDGVGVVEAAHPGRNFRSGAGTSR